MVKPYNFNVYVSFFYQSSKLFVKSEALLGYKVF